MMGKGLRYLIWLCICVGITIMVFFQIVNHAAGSLETNEMIELAVLNPQKMLFNNMLYFAGLIYISYRDYMNPQVALRYKNNTMKIMVRLMLHGLKLFFVYAVMVIFSVCLSTILVGADISQFSGNLSLLFLLPFCWYCIYFTVYVLSQKHYTGLIALVSSQLIVLVAGSMLNFSVEFNIFPYVLNYQIALPVAICLCGIAAIVQEKREWL